MDGTLLEVIGWLGSAVLVVSLLQTNLHRLRWINLVGCLVLIGYNAAVGVWPMVGLNVVLAVINVVRLAQGARDRHDARKYEVLEVPGDDAYLRHVLRVHEADIRRFNPGFVHDPFADQDAYLVLTGDETVGVTIVADEGEGVGQVLLDYVTPRYRDRSPGEFVFGSDGPIGQGRFTTVRTPPGMVAPYYDRLGFVSAGDRYEKRVAR
ncbi:hypothetical protein GCM10022199_23500 [Marihabitans asiaticum]|uniref:Inner membrane protein n=1 Tax=Marihabitans asiaticum TaxID=415218 RepID=A0A560W9X4_9MICO|nr:YgjV family protein [Marihabitans asiaticum]TWD14429.1 hypothetical protein FB557_1839 [Marihabitans asiaticum]